MPIPIKTIPELRVRCFPRTAIPQRGTSGAYVAVVLGNSMGTGAGTGNNAMSGIDPINPMLGQTWFGGGGGLSRVGKRLEFVRFKKDGRFTAGASAASAGGEDEVSGFCLRTVETPLDWQIGAGAVTSGLTGIAGTAQSGTWARVKSGNEGNASAAVNTGTHQSAVLRSATLSENQGLKWTLRAQALITGTTAASAPPPSAFLSAAGGTLGVLLRDGREAQVQRKINNQWVTLRSCEGVKCDLRNGQHEVRMRRINGRGVVEIDGHGWHFTNLESTPAANGQSAPQPGEWIWPAGAATVEARACRLSATIARIDYDGDGPDEDRQLVHSQPRSSYATGAREGTAAGWVGGGSACSALVTAPKKALETSVTFFASPDKRDTPFINKIGGIFESGAWTGGIENESDFIDIAPAVISAALDLAYPPAQAGSTLNLEVDRSLLDQMFPEPYVAPDVVEPLPDGGTVTYPGESGGLEWGKYINSYCPIAFEARWHYSDKSVSPWTKFFNGYIFVQKGATPGVNQKTLSLSCQNPICRLRRPAGIVKPKHPPLDVFWMEKLRRVRPKQDGAPNRHGMFDPGNNQSPSDPAIQNPSTLGYSGGDGVRDILRLFLGPEADRLHVDLPNNHYPLLGTYQDPFGYIQLDQLASGSGTTATVNGWKLPAPWKDDALGWIYQLCSKDQAVFFYGWLTNDDFADWPRPIYGTMERILSNRPTHRIPDSGYLPADINRALEAIERTNRPEADINEVLVLGTGLYGNAMDGLLPAARIAEDRLVPPDVNAAKYTWPRTEVIENNMAAFPGGAEALALTFMELFKGAGYQNWPSVTLRGRCYDPLHDERPICIGDLIDFEMSGPESDRSLNVENTTYRAGRVRHLWTMGEVSDMKSECSLRPRASTGL